ncbi:MAG: hypothetical protein ABF695_01215 [Liquorilactobacillus ghanensis]
MENQMKEIKVIIASIMEREPECAEKISLSSSLEEDLNLIQLE